MTNFFALTTIFLCLLCAAAYWERRCKVRYELIQQLNQMFCTTWNEVKPKVMSHFERELEQSKKLWNLLADLTKEKK